MYHGTNGTPGTFGTLLCQKTAFLDVKRPFLNAFYCNFWTKNACFSLKNSLKNHFFVRFQSKNNLFS